jgi:hypothetical protein
MFSNTKMCRFFILGKCAKGPQCPFAHDKIELRNMPDLRCTKLCKELLENGECNDKSCTYAHNKEELRSTGAFQRTKLCRNLQFGRCPRGDKCNFAHSEAELQAPKTIQGFRTLPAGLAMDHDGDEQSTRISGSRSGSGDSNSSDHGSVTASVTDALEPAYVHITPFTDFADPKACRRNYAPMSMQKVDGPRSLGDIIPDSMPKSLALQKGSGFGDFEGIASDPMQNAFVESNPRLREYFLVLEELDRRTKMMTQRPYISM